MPNPSLSPETCEDPNALEGNRQFSVPGKGWPRLKDVFGSDKWNPNLKVEPNGDLRDPEFAEEIGLNSQDFESYYGESPEFHSTANKGSANGPKGVKTFKR